MGSKILAVIILALPATCRAGIVGLGGDWAIIQHYIETTPDKAQEAQDLLRKENVTHFLISKSTRIAGMVFLGWDDPKDHPAVDVSAIAVADVPAEEPDKSAVVTPGEKVVLEDARNKILAKTATQADKDALMVFLIDILTK